MNKRYARQLANTITNEELLEMLNNAKENITNWEAISNVNEGITKGTAWNILGKNFKLNLSYHPLAKSNMIREFGNYLPHHILPNKKAKKNSTTPIHQQPIFD